MDTRKYVWFITVYCDPDATGPKLADIPSIRDIADYDVVECVTSGEDACASDHIHIVTRRVKPVKAIHVAKIIGTTLGVPVHPSAVRNEIRGKVTVEGAGDEVPQTADYRQLQMARQVRPGEAYLDRRDRSP